MNAVLKCTNQLLGRTRSARSSRLIGELRWRDASAFTLSQKRDDAVVVSIGEKVERDTSVLANAKQGSSIGARRAAIDLPHHREGSLEMLFIARRHRLAARPKVK